MAFRVATARRAGRSRVGVAFGEAPRVAEADQANALIARVRFTASTRPAPPRGNQCRGGELTGAGLDAVGQRATTSSNIAHFGLSSSYHDEW